MYSASDVLCMYLSISILMCILNFYIFNFPKMYKNIRSLSISCIGKKLYSRARCLFLTILSVDAKSTQSTVIIRDSISVFLLPIFMGLSRRISCG